MSASNLSKVITSRPANATAARVTAPGPRGYESSKKILTVCSPTPPAMRPVPRDQGPNRTFANLTGAKRGKLTVVGLAEQRTKDGKALWVCRCTCGYYTQRHAKAIKNERNQQDMCDRCRQVVYLRYKSHFLQTGEDKDIQEFV